ncbi:MAG: hypothetical protein WAW69_02480, partial [Polaromonas sp.]
MHPDRRGADDFCGEPAENGTPWQHHCTYGVPSLLNTLWLGFFVTAAIAAMAQWLMGGNAHI